MKLRLFHYWRSSSSWRVRWALELKGLRPEFVHVDLLSGESESEPHASRHPFGYVPVLEADGRNLVESVAILEWLEETRPVPQLYPGDAFQRAQIRALVETVNSGTQPIQNLNVTDRVSDDPRKREEWSRHFIHRGLAAYEQLASRSAGRYSVGDQVTAADLFLVPQCYNAIRFGVALREFPLVERIHSVALATPEAQASAPDRFKP